MSFAIPTLRSYLSQNAGTSYDYSAFCSSYGLGNCSIPGLSVLLNSTAYTCDSYNQINSASVTVTFNWTAALQNYLANNTDVTLYYLATNITCSSGRPKRQADQSGYLTINGQTITINRNACDSSTYTTDVTLTVVMTTPTSRFLFNDICCIPYGNACGVISVTSYFPFSIGT